MTLEGGVRRGVGPRLLLLMVRLLTERYHRALSRWKYYALCSQSLSLCFGVSATTPAFASLYSSYYFGIMEKRVFYGVLAQNSTKNSVGTSFFSGTPILRLYGRPIQLRS